MNKFTVSTSAGADLDIDYIVTNNVPMIPMSYVIEEGLNVVTHTHGSGSPEIGMHEFYERISTCAYARSISIPENQFFDHFTSIYSNNNNNNNNKYILHLCLSSQVSGNFQNARLAAYRFNQSHPDAQVIVVDTKQISHGLSLMVQDVVRLRDSGLSLEDAVKWLELNKIYYCTYLTISDPFCLRRSGRAPYLMEFLEEDLGQKPIFKVDHEGKVFPIEKYKSRKETIYRLYELFKRDMRTPATHVIIGHANCKEDAETLRALVEKHTTVSVEMMGPIIGISAGPGSLAICFNGNNR